MISHAVECVFQMSKHTTRVFLPWFHMWCDLRKPVTCRTGWNCTIKEINSIILMFFFIFHSLLTSVTFDTNITEDPIKKFWNDDNSNFYMIPITQNWYFAPCEGFSQITSHILHVYTRINSPEIHNVPCVTSRHICKLDREKGVFFAAGEIFIQGAFVM